MISQTIMVGFSYQFTLFVREETSFFLTTQICVIFSLSNFINEEKKWMKEKSCCFLCLTYILTYIADTHARKDFLFFSEKRKNSNVIIHFGVDWTNLFFFRKCSTNWIEWAAHKLITATDDMHNLIWASMTNILNEI